MDMCDITSHMSHATCIDTCGVTRVWRDTCATRVRDLRVAGERDAKDKKKEEHAKLFDRLHKCLLEWNKKIKVECNKLWGGYD